MKLLAAVIAGLHVLVEMSITAFGAAQWPLNYVFHPVSFQSWVSFVDSAYIEFVLMEANAAARLPAAVLEWHADTIGGTEYKVFYVRMPNLNQTGNLPEIVRVLPRSRALQLHDLLNPGSGL